MPRKYISKGRSVTCLGTFWHCCLGTLLHSCLGTYNIPLIRNERLQGWSDRLALLSRDVPALLSGNIVTNLTGDVLANLLRNSGGNLLAALARFISTLLSRDAASTNMLIPVRSTSRSLTSDKPVLGRWSTAALGRSGTVGGGRWYIAVLEHS